MLHATFIGFILLFSLSALSCSNDEKFGGGASGHQAYLDWLATQNLDVQFQKNNNKMVTKTSDFFEDKKENLKQVPGGSQQLQESQSERGIRRISPY